MNKGGPSDNDRESACIVAGQDGTTDGPSVPGAPRYLVAGRPREDSSGANSELTDAKGVVLLWDTLPNIPPGDEIEGYVIERKRRRRGLGPMS